MIALVIKMDTENTNQKKQNGRKSQTQKTKITGKERKKG
jgi:hypothetical protein